MATPSTNQQSCCEVAQYALQGGHHSATPLGGQTQVGESWPSLVEFGPNSTEFGPEFADSGGSFGRCRSRVCPNSLVALGKTPNIKPLPDVGRFRAKPGRRISHITRLRSASGAIGATEGVGRTHRCLPGRQMPQTS